MTSEKRTITLRRHPSRQELVAYAENLVDQRTAISAPMARHIASCKHCAQEVKAVRNSLIFTASAPKPQPSQDLTKRILLQARHLRYEEQRRQRFRTRLRTTFQGAAYAAILLVIAGVVFGAALGNEDGATFVNAERKVAASQPAQDPVLSAENMQKTLDEVQALATAMRPTGQQGNAAEAHYRRVYTALETDVNAIMQALERNPGYAQANHMLYANLQRQAQTLRSLYKEREL